MEFRTKIPISPQEPKIGYDSGILLLGSCFVENIGSKLEYAKFKTLQNPFGILFHPAAIAGFLEKVQTRHRFSEADIFYHNERWHSFDAHSALSHPDKEEMLQRLNAAVEVAYHFLETMSHVIITPGTAWAYDLLETGQTVANCHKLPQKNFRKELKEVKEDLKRSVEMIHSLNPEASVVFTVSPVRHLKDGFVENQVSKAKLITAISELIKEPALEGRVHYFPSYEIMMDELRDYRFYKEDMIHPSATAVDYIWQRFNDCWMSREAFATMDEVQKIQRGLAHKPFNENSEAHKQFLKKLHEKIADLQEQWPEMRF